MAIRRERMTDDSIHFEPESQIRLSLITRIIPTFIMQNIEVGIGKTLRIMESRDF